MAIAPKKTPAKALTPAEKRAASTKAMVASLQSSLNDGTVTGVMNGKKQILNSIDSGTGTGIVNSKVPLRNPVPDVMDSLHQTGNLPRPTRFVGGAPVSGAIAAPKKPSTKPSGKNTPSTETPLPPTGGTTTSATPKPYMNKDWSKVVSHYFPETEGMKAGGMVRGCGAAAKGGGRGKIV